MNDQADRLRQMVLDAPPPTGVAQEHPRPLLVVSGGSAGVGTTTLTIELATDFTRHGNRRVVLVDANFSRPALAARCGRVERGTLCDVLAGRRTVNEIVLRGPDGVQIVPGGRWREPPLRQTHGRLLDQLRRLRDSADLVIVDAGKGCGETVQLFWQVATTILLVTTPDPDSILHGYAAIKAAAKRAAPEKICVVANRVGRDRAEDGQIQQRIRQACHRFLGAAIDAGPSVPVEPFVDRTGPVGPSPTPGGCNPSPALEVRALAEHLTQRLGLPGRPREVRASVGG